MHDFASQNRGMGFWFGKCDECMIGNQSSVMGKLLCQFFKKNSIRAAASS